MNSLVVQRGAIVVLISPTKMKELQACIDLSSQFLDRKVVEQTIWVDLRPESEILVDDDESTEDEDFTTKSSFRKESSPEKSDGEDNGCNVGFQPSAIW